KSGVYFSLRASAVDIWLMIEAGASRSAIVASLLSSYDGDPGVVGAAVDRCVTEFLQDGLIQERPANGPAASDAVFYGSKRPFAEPLIERFTDMQNLLLLDPVHEVTDEGWPQQLHST